MVPTSTNQKRFKSHIWHYDLTWVLVESQSSSSLARLNSHFAGVRGASPADRCFHGHQTLYLHQSQYFSGVVIGSDYHI